MKGRRTIGGWECHFRGEKTEVAQCPLVVGTDSSDLEEVCYHSLLPLPLPTQGRSPLIDLSGLLWGNSSSSSGKGNRRRGGCGVAGARRAGVGGASASVRPTTTDRSSD